MNNLPVCNSLKEAIRLTFGRDVTIESRQRVHGGDANDSYALLLSNGKRAFIKENTISNADSFRAEAEGIDAIKSTNTLRVPEIYALGTDAGNSFLTGTGAGSFGISVTCLITIRHSLAYSSDLLIT